MKTPGKLTVNCNKYYLKNLVHSESQNLRMKGPEEKKHCLSDIQIWINRDRKESQTMAHVHKWDNFNTLWI